MRAIDADKLKYITMQKTELPPSVIQEILQLIEEQETICGSEFIKEGEEDGLENN